MKREREIIQRATTTVPMVEYDRRMAPFIVCVYVLLYVMVVLVVVIVAIMVVKTILMMMLLVVDQVTG